MIPPEQPSKYKRYSPAVKSPQVVGEIVHVNFNTKPSTPAPPPRSFSIDVTTAASTHSTSQSSSSSSSSSSAFKVSHPSRKYFDSGDYELARAGILSSASVGSIHPSADKLPMSSASRSAQNSRDELACFGKSSGETTSVVCRNLSAPNTATHLQKSTFSMTSLDESDYEMDEC